MFGGSFHFVGFKIILGSFGALVSKWPVTQKTAGRKVKRCKILVLIGTSNTYVGHLHVRYIGSSYMSARHKPDLFLSGK